MKKRILTGDRPTGKLHIGHYIGSLENRVKLQYEYESFILIADLQALTDNFDHPENITKNVKEVILDYLAVGIDPKISTVVIQSQIPEIPELTGYFMNLVTLSRLQRNPTVKDEIKEKKFEINIPVGFLCYPVSQAADITIFGADLVPVGEDQVPMIEQTRELVRRFNNLYGKTLKEPKALVSRVGRLPGTDGRAKMSKSLGNVIELAESKESLRKKVMNMYTDPTRIHPTDPGHIKGNPVFTYLDAFSKDVKLVSELKSRYRKGKVGDVEVKEILFKILEEFLKPIRDRRKEYENKPEYLKKIMKEGVKRARETTKETIKRVQKAINLIYF